MQNGKGRIHEREILEKQSNLIIDTLHIEFDNKSADSDQSM